MREKQYIMLRELCEQYELEMAFFSALQDFELIQVERIEKAECVRLEEIRQIERMVRLHKELEINVAGIEAVIHLIDKVEALQDELARVRSRLRLYE